MKLRGSGGFYVRAYPFEKQEVWVNNVFSVSVYFMAIKEGVARLLFKIAMQYPPFVR